jgi:hypothetical protein
MLAIRERRSIRRRRPDIRRRDQRDQYAAMDSGWAARYVPTVEQQAEKALPELRLELFRAEQRILDAQVHADYYRARLAFCESVLKNGIEQVSDKRKKPERLLRRYGPVQS